MLLSEGERFAVANMRQRIFRRRPGESVTPYNPAPLKMDAATGTELREAGRKRRLRDLALETSPNAIIAVGPDGSIVLINAAARAQFGLTPYDLNRPFRDLEISYRPTELRSLIEQAENERRTVRVPGAERRLHDGDSQFLDIVIQPMSTDDGQLVGVALTFLDTTVATRLHNELTRTRGELETAYDTLQSTNEELETTNEELQSSIEELETTNEELQSTNEELETTNEELQSGNEELETMNEEMRIRSGELDTARGFLEGVLSSIAAGVVVLDADLRVHSWNRGAEDLWGLRAREVYLRPFFALDFGLPTEEVRNIVAACQSTGIRSGPTDIVAVNRIGRGILCSIACSPMDGGGVVLLMEDNNHD
jgi:two-component system, chemotaxis family, CheB/CheR fusion protein